MNERQVRGVKLLKISALSAVIVAVLSTGCGGGQEAPPEPLDLVPKDKAVVLVGDKSVSGAWLYNWCRVQELKLLTGGLRVDHHSLIDGGRTLLTKIVVLASEAEDLGLTISDEEIDEQLSKEMSAFESTQLWSERLQAAGLTIEERKEQIRLELLFNKYREEIVAPKVREERVTDAIARRYYDEGLADENNSSFVEPHRVHLWHMLRSVSQDAPASERDREREVIKQARDRIEAGEKFEDVARELSTDPSAIKGGDLGWVDATAPMLDELKKIAMELEQGELSPVHESAHGFHLIYASEVRPERTLPYSEVKDTIKERLYEEWMKRYLETAAYEIQQKKQVQFLDLTPYIGEPPAAPQPVDAAATGEAPQPQGS